MLKDQHPMAVDENAVDSSHATITLGPLRGVNSSNSYPLQTQAVYHGGYENTIGRWGTCLQDANAKGMENGSYGMWTDSSSLPFHGYGHTPQMPQRPYAPLTTLPPSVSRHGRLYNVQEFPNSDPPYYQHFASPNIPYAASQTPVSQAKLPVNVDPRGNMNRFGPRPGYFPMLESFGGGNFSGNSAGYKFLQRGFAGFESGELWSDWSKPMNGKRSLVYLSSPAASPKPIGSLGLSVNQFGMASQQKESCYGFGSHSGPSCKNYPQGQNDQDPCYEVVSSSILGMNGQNWPTLHEARHGGSCNDFSCSCTVALDMLNERNRGPRAFKPRGQTTADGSSVDNQSNTSADIHSESYNRLDFVTDHNDAKFFVIKSYSEDNVHKSIKYGVWASTQNGNKKLDAAYREAKEKHGPCPVFLLFSVNASAQFCGVAEMVGPVDFHKSVDYWQQDKWSGQFPVKWHIIKDVPNSQFRHIVLENNDNKPVTNSRDTQEVELEHGIEMLKIFKNHEGLSSILDDFLFYEERQKATKAKKLRQQASPVPTSVVGVGEQNTVALSNGFIKKMSKSFAEAVLLNDNETKLSPSHTSDGTIRVKPE